MYLTLFNFHCVELEYLTVQYWATSATSLGVLVFLYIVISHATDNMGPRSRISLDAKLSLSGIVLYSVVCSVSLATTSHTGEFLILHLLFFIFLTSVVFYNDQDQKIKMRKLI
jgi:dolichol kinase